VKTFHGERYKSENIMIPVRRFSSMKISVEGVFWSSRRRQKKKVGKAVRHTLTSFEVLIEDMTSLGIFSVLLDDNTGTTNNLPGIAIAVNLAEACPFAQDLCVSDLNEWNGMGGAKCFDELDILRLRASLDKHTKVGLTPIQRLCALAQTTRKTVVLKRLLQDLLIIARNFRSHITGKEQC